MKYLTDLEYLEIVHVSTSRFPEEEKKRSRVLYYYEIRHAEDDFDAPIAIETVVKVNRWGWIATSAPLPIIDRDAPPLMIPERLREHFRMRAFAEDFHSQILIAETLNKVR